MIRLPTWCHFRWKDGDERSRHLSRDLQEIAAADDAQRIAFIRGQWWIGYPQAQAALDLLSAAIDNEPGRVRPQCFRAGPTNNGKSMIIEKFRRDHMPPALPGRDEENIPVVVVQMLTDPGVARSTSIFSRFWERRFAGRPANMISSKRWRCRSSRGLAHESHHRRTAQSSGWYRTGTAGIPQFVAVSRQRAAI